jgi:hypothetical protein
VSQKLTIEGEAELRKQARASDNARAILADYYEESGQPSRAAMWREPRTVGIGVDPDLNVPDKSSCAEDSRRAAMIWLLQHVMSERAIAKALDVSGTRVRQILHRLDRDILTIKAAELRHPTMAATQRLGAAGALRSASMDVFGEPPPADWPMNRRRRSRSKVATNGR